MISRDFCIPSPDWASVLTQPSHKPPFSIGRAKGLPYFAIRILRRPQAQQAGALAAAQHEAGIATLRGEVDRLVSHLADLRAALGRGSESSAK